MDDGKPKVIHVVAENVGEAMIEFRTHEQFESWNVEKISQIKEGIIIDLQKKVAFL